MNNLEKKIESLFSAALSLQGAGEGKKAIDLLDEIIQKKPDFVDAYVLKGAILQDEEDFIEAESSYRIALELERNQPEALQGFGLFLVSQERYEESITYLKKHLEMSPEDETSLNGLIKAFSNLPNREDDILETLRQAWAKSQNIDIGLKYGFYLSVINNEKDKAYEVFKDVLDLSKTITTLTEFAYSCWYFDDYDMAIDLLKEAISIDSSSIVAWRLLANCYYQKDDYSKALETVEEAIALDSNDYRNWRLKTDIFIKNKEYEKALISAEKGIKLIEKNSEILESLKDTLVNPFFQKIFILLKQEEISKALETVTEAKNLIPKNIHFYLYPAQKLTELGLTNKALELLDSNEDPELEKYFEPYRYLLLHRLNRIEEAKRFIEPIINSTPEKSDFLAAIAADKYFDGEPLLDLGVT